MQTETKAADATVKKATTATEKKTTGLKQTASKTETNKKADAPKKRGRKPGSKNKPKEQLAPEVYLQYCGRRSRPECYYRKNQRTVCIRGTQSRQYQVVENFT